MDSIKIREMLLQAVNVQESWNLIQEVGKATLNHEKHDEEKAIKAFYNIASRVKDIINKEHYGNLQFERGEKKEFAKEMYEYFMEE